MKKRLIILLLIAMLSTNLCACSNEKATVTTTVYAVKYLVEQLASDRVNVEYMSDGEFIQRATMSERYKDILNATTVFIYISELEPYMDVYPDLLQGYDFDVINLANLSAIYDYKRYTRVNAQDITVTKESDYYEGEVFNDIDLYKKDPFIWVDPIAMSSMASTIKDWLISYYPEDTLVIENNFKELQATFVRMDAEYQELNKINDIKMVTVTAGFGNWQKLYGVQVYPLILSKYGVLPTDEQLEVIKKKIVEDKVEYIVYDATLPDDMLKLYNEVKDELKLKEIKLSSLSKLSVEDLEKGKTYPTIMYENLTNIENAFKK